MPPENPPIYEFGPFRLDAGARLLLRAGEPVALTPKAVETLFALIKSEGRVMSREELLRQVWPDTFVEENNLSVNVSALRKALGTTPEGKPYIETLPRRGYRFTAEVRRAEANGSGLVLERGTREQVVVVEEVGGDELRPGRPEFNFAPAALSRRTATGRRRGRQALTAAAALLVAAAGVFFYVRQRGERRQPASAIKSLAVLPLRPIGSAERSENYLGVGLADALITRLGSLGEVSVRPTSAVLRFDKTERDSLSAARALGVDAVLEGSYQREGDRIRVTVQLVSAGDGTQLWSGAFDDEFTNIFSVQDSISTEVAEALMTNLNEVERRGLLKRPTTSVDVYQAYLKGRYFWNKRTGEGFEKAVGYFKQAIDKDPAFAPAYAGLADAHGLMAQRGFSPPLDAYPKAGEAASRALELDETLADAHFSMAFVKEQYDFDWAGAGREYKRAIELDPGSAYAHGGYGMHLVQRGRFDEAFTVLKRAEALDPLSPSFAVYLGWHYYFSRQYDQAIAQSAKALELDPNFSTAHSIIGAAYEQKGSYDEAVGHYLSRVEPAEAASLKEAYEASGMRGYRLRRLDQLTAAARERYVSAYPIAELHAGLGQTGQALVWLHKAYEERAGGITFIQVNPAFDGLRSDPGFRNLLRRVGLTQEK